MLRELAGNLTEKVVAYEYIEPASRKHLHENVFIYVKRVWVNFQVDSNGIFYLCMTTEASSTASSCANHGGRPLASISLPDKKACPY